MNQITEVFEVVSCSDEETYFSMGMFLSLEDATKAINKRSPEEWGLNIIDYVLVSVREIKIGWHNNTYETVFSKRMERTFDDEAYCWVWKECGIKGDEADAEMSRFIGRS